MLRITARTYSFMNLQSLNEYYENKLLKLDDPQIENEPDVFALEDEYKTALKLTTQDANNEAIEILEKLLNHSLLEITTDENVKETDANGTPKKRSHPKRQQSQRSSEFALQLKKCVLKNLAILYEKVNNIDGCQNCYSTLYNLDQNDITVVYSYAVFLFNCAQLIPSYQLFLECIQLHKTHWKSYEYALVCFYLMKDVKMCNMIMEKVSQRANLHMPSYVICHLFAAEDGVDDNRLFYNEKSIKEIQLKFNTLFQSTMDLIKAKIQQYRHRLSVTSFDVVPLEIPCVNRVSTTDEKYNSTFVQSLNWFYPYKSYENIGRFLLDIYHHLPNGNLFFTVNLKALEFDDSTRSTYILTSTNEQIAIVDNNNIIQDNIEVLSGNISDCESADNTSNKEEDENEKTVKHVTRRQTRTKDQTTSVSTSLYEKLYGMLRELINSLNVPITLHPCDKVPQNQSITKTSNEINKIVDEPPIESTSNYFQDHIDEFLTANSTIVIFLDIVHRWLKQFVKFDTRLTLDQWSLDLCHIFYELSILLHNQRDITPIYLCTTTSEFPDQEYVLNAFIMVRTLEIKFILAPNAPSNICTGEVDKLDLMFEYIDTVVVFCRVKLNEAKGNPPESLLFMVVRQSWMLAHSHMVTNPNNYEAIEAQLAECKRLMQTYGLDSVKIFPNDSSNVSLTQINLLMESFSVKKKIDGFKTLIDSRNYSNALEVLQSFNITIPERFYIDHKLVRSESPLIENVSIIDSSSSIIHGNMQKQLALLITCHNGLGHITQVIKCVLSCIHFCLNDYNTLQMDTKVDNKNEFAINSLKQLFQYWAIEEGLTLLGVCFKRSGTHGFDDNNSNKSKVVLIDCNLYTDALAQLANLLTQVLPYHGDNWIDLMIVHCVKLLWYLTKSLSICVGGKFVNSKIKQAIFHMADELISILMTNGKLCCRLPYCKWVLSDILLDLNDIYVCNSFKHVVMVGESSTSTNSHMESDSINVTLNSSFSDESYRNTMLIYYSCLLGYPLASKIKHLTRNGVVHLNERCSINSAASSLTNVGVPCELLTFPVVMAAFEFFKPTDQVTLGPYLFKVASSTISHTRPMLNGDLFKLFQVLTNVIIYELELVFHNFKNDCKRLRNFIRCRKQQHCTIPPLRNWCVDTKLPTHLYNARFILQFVIDYYLKMSLGQGSKYLSEARKMISIYLFMASNDYFGWWATFCYCIYYVNVEVSNYYELQTTINISTDHLLNTSSIYNTNLIPPTVLVANKKIAKMANLALNSLQLAITLCDDINFKLILQLDLARAFLLFSTYEFSVCIFRSQPKKHAPTTHSLPSSSSFDEHLKNHVKLVEDVCCVDNNFLVSPSTYGHEIEHEKCTLCGIYNVRRNLQMCSHEKFTELLKEYVELDDGDVIDKFGPQRDVTNSRFPWYIYYMNYKSFVLCDSSNLNTKKAAQLLEATLCSFFKHVNCTIEQLDKFLIHQHLSDSSKCFYQLLSGVFNFLCAHNNCEIIGTGFPLNLCFCSPLLHMLNPIMEAVMKVDKNNESVEFVVSSTTLRNDSSTDIQPIQWPLFVSIFKDSTYYCASHGNNIGIKMCDHYLLMVLEKIQLFMIVILKRFYSNYDYVRLLVSYLYERCDMRCSLVNQFLQYLITGNVNSFSSILFTNSKLDMFAQLFGFAKVIKYLKPTYSGIINLYGKGHLFKHAWRTGIEEIESLDDFQFGLTNIFSLFVHSIELSYNNSTKDDIYARLALKLDSNVTKSYLLPFVGVSLVRKIFFYLITRIIEFKMALIENESIIDVSHANKFLYVALKIYKSNVLFEKSKRNDLLTCLDVINGKLTNRLVPINKDYPGFFTSQQKKELFDYVHKYFIQIKYNFL